MGVAASALSWVAARVCPPSGPLYMYRARSVAKDVAVWTYMALLVLLALLAPLWPPAITPLQRTLGDPAHFSHDFNRSIVSMGFLKVGGAPCGWGGLCRVPGLRSCVLCLCVPVHVAFPVIHAERSAFEGGQ